MLSSQLWLIRIHTYSILRSLLLSSEQPCTCFGIVPISKTYSASSTSDLFGYRGVVFASRRIFFIFWAVDCHVPPSAQETHRSFWLWVGIMYRFLLPAPSLPDNILYILHLRFLVPFFLVGWLWFCFIFLLRAAVHPSGSKTSHKQTQKTVYNLSRIPPSGPESVCAETPHRGSQTRVQQDFP